MRVQGRTSKMQSRSSDEQMTAVFFSWVPGCGGLGMCVCVCVWQLAYDHQNKHSRPNDLSKELAEPETKKQVGVKYKSKSSSKLFQCIEHQG